MSFQDDVWLWNHAALKVVDARRAVIQPGDSLRAHQLTAGSFLCTVQGKARIRLGDVQYQAGPYHICHAGKGSSFAVDSVQEALEYYLLQYKATLALPCREELLRLQQKRDPFQRAHSFTPRYPLSLFGTIRQLHEKWQKASMLDRLHAKALLHQFVYEWLQQRQEQAEEPTPQSLVDKAIRLIEEQFSEKMTLHALASQVGCQERQLQRLFKAALAVGPMEYLLRVRVEKAKELLLKLNVPLMHIAESVGFSDSYYFSRLFKKYVGISPSQFRKMAGQLELCRQNPSRLSLSFIGGKHVPLYSITDENGSHSQQGTAVAAPASTALLAHRSKRAKQADAEEGVAKATSKRIRHLRGELELDRLIERIAVLDYQYIDQMYALGHLPVGSVFATTSLSGLPEYLGEKMSAIKRLGTKDHPDLTAIAELSPELIVCTDTHAHLYDELVAIAPTVMLDRNDDWRTTLPVLGKMLGKEQEAQHVIDAYNQKIVHLKDAIAAKLGGKTVSLIRPRDNMIRLHTTAHRTARILYRDLGIAPPPMAMDSKRTSSYIQLDAMAELNADHLFVLQDDTNAALTSAYQESAVWRSLGVVKANHVRTFDTTMWIGFYGPVAINRVVDEIADALLS
ncbi:helix-turn-helix domain-containing protein [Brevibacillus sp. SAFN-007a]|uniref:helix-turn-helix domain-containing protein n=1 Tax=Brevibacillus sp. SAFN-007a TaxID=3436862 RepID=UPI003F81EA66